MAKENQFTKHKLFQATLKKAKDVIQDPQKLRQITSDLQAKFQNEKNGKGYFNKMIIKGKTAIRMVKAYSSGQYREIPWKAIVSIVGALLYILMPIDIIPDFIPLTGYLDDLTILTFVFNSFSNDIDQFIQWENENSITKGQ